LREGELLLLGEKGAIGEDGWAFGEPLDELVHEIWDAENGEEEDDDGFFGWFRLTLRCSRLSVYKRLEFLAQSPSWDDTFAREDALDPANEAKYTEYLA
jgi:hypothetical protein